MNGFRLPPVVKAERRAMMDQKVGDVSMRVSESEAATRLCPFTLNGASKGTNCAGAKCMAWRWVGKENGFHPGEGFCGMAPHFPSR